MTEFILRCVRSMILCERRKLSRAGLFVMPAFCLYAGVASTVRLEAGLEAVDVLLLLLPTDMVAAFFAEVMEATCAMPTGEFSICPLAVGDAQQSVLFCGMLWSGVCSFLRLLVRVSSKLDVDDDDGSG